MMQKKENNKLTIILAGLIILALMPAAAAELTISIDIKPSFELNEVIFFDYTITSEENLNITFFPAIKCEFTPVLEEKTATLKEGVPYKETYTYSTVDESFEPQICTAGVYVIDPTEMMEEKNFSIETLPSFEFELKICKDENCAEPKLIFLQQETAYLNYECSIPEISAEATITLPNGIQQQTSLPTSLKIEQTGTYSIQATASSEGYKTVTAEKQFGSIKKSAEIKSVSECNADGICNNEENYQNCPQDCKSGQSDNFCDMAKDGICDVDCKKEEDPDCQITKEKEEAVIGKEEIPEKIIEKKVEEKEVVEEKKYETIIFSLIIIILLIIALFFVRKRKKGKI